MLTSVRPGSHPLLPDVTLPEARRSTQCMNILKANAFWFSKARRGALAELKQEGGCDPQRMQQLQEAYGLTVHSSGASETVGSVVSMLSSKAWPQSPLPATSSLPLQ